MKEKLTQLSKVISHALRHSPSEYNLKLDAQGWSSITELLIALQSKDDQWKDLCASDLEEMIECISKQRHEIKSGKIRALYGHSFKEKILKEAKIPPCFLYHGTSLQAEKLICKLGLKPMKRHYIHLSIDSELAMQVGGRKTLNPILLTIRAKEANQNGIKFYFGNENIWLADYIPPEYIDLHFGR